MQGLNLAGAHRSAAPVYFLTQERSSGTFSDTARRIFSARPIRIAVDNTMTKDDGHDLHLPHSLKLCGISRSGALRSRSISTAGKKS